MIFQMFIQDVVLYLSDGLCYTEAGQPVYVAQEEQHEEEVAGMSMRRSMEEHEEVVAGRTEVQSAILSIVETAADASVD